MNRKSRRTRRLDFVPGASNRRQFLRLAARWAGGMTAAGLLPPSIRGALAIPAAKVSGTIQDVKHVVILMQENRSFDHYFGTLRGVRGFGRPPPGPAPGRKSGLDPIGRKE